MQKKRKAEKLNSFPSRPLATRFITRSSCSRRVRYIYYEFIAPPAHYGRLSSHSGLPADSAVAAELLFTVTAGLATRTRIGYTVIVAVTMVMTIGCPTKLSGRLISPTFWPSTNVCFLSIPSYFSYALFAH